MRRRTFLQLLAAAALVRPAIAARSPVNRALGAALAEFLDDPSGYQDIYKEYLGVAPLFLPQPKFVSWPTPDEMKPVLDRGELRLGYCYNPPYHFTGPGGVDEGLDYDLGLALMPSLRSRYGDRLSLRWVEKTVGKSTGDAQVDLYQTLIAALQAGEIDAAFSGVLILDGQPVQWTTPCHQLFTGLFYTGKDKLPLAGLQNGTRVQLFEALEAFQDLELTFMATQNPGPSSATNQLMVDEVIRRGGKARAVAATVPELQAALRTAPVHFLVGDALSLSYFCNRKDFQGINLNMPARDELLPLAPFTL